MAQFGKNGNSEKKIKASDRNDIKRCRHENRILGKKKPKFHIQNHLNMNNTERYNNVALGYNVQASRLNKYVLSAEQVEQVEQTLDIMKKIQSDLYQLAADKLKYDKHLNNGVYCKAFMNKYVKKLQKIIAATDALVKGENKP